MNCPKCSSSMEQGFIQSPRIIIWSSEKHKLSFAPNKDKGDVLVKKENMLGAYKTAFCCSKCGTIVIPKED